MTSSFIPLLLTFCVLLTSSIILIAAILYNKGLVTYRNLAARMSYASLTQVALVTLWSLGFDMFDKNVCLHPPIETRVQRHVTTFLVLLPRYYRDPQLQVPANYYSAAYFVLLSVLLIICRECTRHYTLCSVGIPLLVTW